jgi:ribosomal protein S18 acetylase RimI-like enzyme
MPGFEGDVMTAVPRPSVRVALESDAAHIATVHIRSWQAAYRGLLPQDYLDALDVCERTARWQSRIRSTDWSKSGTVVAVPGPAVLGFAGFGPSRDNSRDPLVGEIRQINLLPEVWGKGIGQRLMSTAVARMASAGYAQATLWVLASNERARRFYEKTGWVADGTTKTEDMGGFPIVQVRYRKQLA